MPVLKIGLVGLGRIGRNLFRILHGREDIDLAVVADPTPADQLEYLLRFDTLLGRFPDALSVKDGWIYAGGRRTRLIDAPNPPHAIDVKWGEHGVDVVIEAAHAPRGRVELEGYLAAGAKRVVLCTPPREAPDLTVVMGVNDRALEPRHRIVSNASCTAHAAALVLQLLDREFGVERALLTTVHAYTDEQRLADVPAEDLRRGRAAAENIIPQETRTAEVLDQLLPEIAGKVTAMSLNVPVANGSVVDLVSWHRQDVTVEAINEVVRTAAFGPLRRYLAFEDQPIVSSDVLRSPFSGTFDAQATMVVGKRVAKTLTWFDNGWAYALRAVELCERLAAFGDWKPGEAGR
ncbi:MAG: glyceraldehyde 3-phosphate dehydrogenase NAD-binding domain-containing protein [Acidobacteriota bacterium]